MFEGRVKRMFGADTPDRLWMTDITQQAGACWLYCSAVLDVFSAVALTGRSRITCVPSRPVPCRRNARSF